MAEGEMAYSGKYFRAEGFDGRPKPIQRPHPPIMIGGGAERILSLAGREANIVSFNFNNRSGVIGPDGVQTSTAELTAQKVEWVRKAAGARFPEIELEIGAYFTFVTDQPKEVSEGMAGMFGISGEEMRAHPHALFGSPDAICEELQRRRESYGISYVTINDIQMEDFAPVVARLAGR
jgi:alkanesulfonate monooxygenase SsuD/methylene tetrahydromethanopterin reductase-like flavin-dependent oxidoreductase (luciferase family)